MRSSLDDLTSSYSSRWGNNKAINLSTHHLESPTSAKSDSVFVTPIGRAPIARKVSLPSCRCLEGASTNTFPFTDSNRRVQPLRIYQPLAVV